ncbi:MAG: hypothetical protein AB1916_04545 [Thermodesulfobacteriota bacterium]
MSDKITRLYDEKGKLLGVFIAAELWTRLEPELAAHLPASAPAVEPPLPEPLADWATLLEFWDFPYPVDTDVSCSACGNSTVDWQRDEPRKFRLSACNLGGLVRFECQSCRSRIMKRHFKDKITVETKPFEA